MKEFIEAVKQMREFQKTYFKVKTYDSLIRSKEAERKVDKMIDDLDPDSNSTLF